MEVLNVIHFVALINFAFSSAISPVSEKLSISLPIVSFSLSVYSYVSSLVCSTVNIFCSTIVGHSTD